jgi:hypothetical protein
MNPNNRVFRLDWFPSDELPVGSSMLGLRVAAVFGPEALEKRLDGLRKTVVCRCLGGPGCIAAGLGDGEEG